ncbi:hypothetical protein ACWDKQ_11165 [Saccharopolyspora sp. NPDC000995]
MITCTVTALTVVITKTQFWMDAQPQVLAGCDTPHDVTVSSESFATVLPWLPDVLTLAVAVFASYRSSPGLLRPARVAVFGGGKTSERIYNVVFCLSTVVGSVPTTRTATQGRG